MQRHRDVGSRRRRGPARLARMAAGCVCGGLLIGTPVWLANALTQPTSAAAAAAHAVQIAHCSPYCFDPATVAADPGDGVTWTNTTDATHQIARCDASACGGQGPGTGGDTLSSAALAGSGTSYSHTFNSGGTYFYYCTVHGYNVMHGEIVVSGGPTPTPLPTTKPTPRPTPTRTTVAIPAKTPTPAPTPTATAPASSPSPLAALLSPAGATTSPDNTTAPALGDTGISVTVTGSGAPVVPILLALLIAAGLAAAAYRIWRRGSPAP